MASNLAGCAFGAVAILLLQGFVSLLARLGLIRGDGTIEVTVSDSIQRFGIC